MLPPPCFTVGIVPGFFQTSHLAFRPKSSILVSSFRCLLANSKQAVMCLLLRSGFCLATLPKRPDWWSAAEMDVLLEGSPISTEELWRLSQSDHRVLGHLPDQGPSSPRLLTLARRPVLGRVLVVPNFTHLRMMEATVFLGPFNAADIFGTLPQICASTQSCLGALRTIPLTSWLGFCSDMHCQLWDLI